MPIFDLGRRCRGHVHRRNPILCAALGTEPVHVLQVDSMHTLNFGLMGKSVSASLWRTLVANSWNIPPPMSQILEIGSRRLRDNMFAWFESASIPHDRRISDLTIAMMGGANRAAAEGQRGISFHAKAAEMHILLRWTLVLLHSQ